MDEVIKISAVVITFNEEKNIDRCLHSLKAIADEIVVVDSFSSDQTQSICLHHGVRFIQHAFQGHIQQKNFAVGQASHHYVLSLDADEEISDKLSEQLLKIKKQWRYDAYSFNRLTNYCGKWIKHCGWYPDKKTRLWDRRKGAWSGVNPHDRVEMEPGATLKHLQGDLLHYSYHSISQHIDQVNYFTDIMSAEAYKRNFYPSIILVILSPWFKFVKSYFLKLGFLDGYYGMVVCMISAHATFIKHVKTRALRKERSEA